MIHQDGLDRQCLAIGYMMTYLSDDAVFVKRASVQPDVHFNNKSATATHDGISVGRDIFCSPAQYHNA
jgi:hypothetical protein